VTQADSPPAGGPASPSGVPGTAQRKAEHIRINLEEDVAAKGVTAGWDRYRLAHCALPELDLAAVELGTSFLSHRLSAPILISGMTGGTEQAALINRRLARAAQAVGCAMGLGSIRAAIEEPGLAQTFSVREAAPDVMLLANLGAVQLNYGYGVEQCLRAVELVDAQALVLHLNALQEAVQPGGNTNFGGLLKRIESVCRELPVPVIVKEVGWGITGGLARKLQEAGVAAVDVAGAGGTSWSEVEKHRATTEERAAIASAFADWGIPTADCVTTCRAACPELPLIASGGVRNGVDMAKALALGADLVGVAGPLLRAAAVSDDGARVALETLREELRIAMFAIGAGSTRMLRQVGTKFLLPSG
jgi:isopentenyl-diphosphate Delta-isomerase